MAQKAGACVVLSLLIGCGVGDETTPIDPNPLAISCTDGFKVSGTFTASTPRPVDVEGCWPAGTWTFQLSLDPTDDQILDVTGDQLPDRCGRVPSTSPATFESSYAFTVTRTDQGNGYVDSYAMAGGSFANNCTDGEGRPTSGACVYRLKVSEGGGGECEGSLEIYSADRTELWNLKPSQTTGVTALTGQGEYTKYTEPQTL